MAARARGEKHREKAAAASYVAGGSISIMAWREGKKIAAAWRGAQRRAHQRHIGKASISMKARSAIAYQRMAIKKAPSERRTPRSSIGGGAAAIPAKSRRVISCASAQNAGIAWRRGMAARRKPGFAAYNRAAALRYGVAGGAQQNGSEGGGKWRGGRRRKRKMAATSAARQQQQRGIASNGRGRR